MPPIVAAIVLCAIDALGIGAHDAWLVPSLGSAIFVQVMTPKEPRASLWSTLLGQRVALPAGVIAVFAVLVPLAACAGNGQLYPQPYIGNGAPFTASAEDVSAFKAQAIHSRARADLQDLAETSISREVDPPSGARFHIEFTSKPPTAATAA